MIKQHYLNLFQIQANVKVLTGERDKLNKMYEEVRLILYAVFHKKVYIVLIHYRNYHSLILLKKSFYYCKYARKHSVFSMCAIGRKC